MNLYQLKNNYLETLDNLNTLDLPPEVVRDTLQSLGIEDDIKEKAINIACYIKNLEAEMLAVKDAEKKMQARANSLKSKITSLTLYLKDTMQSCNLPKIHSDLHDIVIQKNPPKLVVMNQALIPEAYWITEQSRKLDSDTIKSKLKEGEPIPGCQIVQETRLKIK